MKCIECGANGYGLHHSASCKYLNVDVYKRIKQLEDEKSEKHYHFGGLGKGIGVGLCGLGIGIATMATGNVDCLWAFVAVMFVAYW